MKAQAETKTVQQWYSCSVAVEEQEGWAHSHPHPDTSFTPQGIIVHRGWERALKQLLLYKDLWVIKTKA